MSSGFVSTAHHARRGGLPPHGRPPQAARALRWQPVKHWLRLVAISGGPIRHNSDDTRTGPVEADGAVDAQNAPTAPWKTLRVFHELPQGFPHPITHDKPRKSPESYWETRIDPSVSTLKGLAALTYVSCWNANEGLLPSLVQDGDVIVSDALNHASLIDAGRLSRQATRTVYPHSDMAALETILADGRDGSVTIVVTDGVFSMEGDLARLPDMVDLCRRYGATLVVDDSHGVGVLGVHGRGTHEHFRLPGTGPDGVDILTGTLGKALGGAAGGYVAGPQPVIDYLIQRSRPQLFSNALPPTVACSASKALEILEREPDRVARLHANADRMRRGLSERLLGMGIFVIGFGFPVVPEGRARLRVQMSAEHTDAHIVAALDAFRKLRGST